MVKADGARMRGIKAPRQDEPIIPAATDVVLHLCSAAVLGAPLDEAVAHRPERLGPVIGAAPGEPLRPEHLAKLIASPEGAGKGVGQARLVAVINQVDDDARLQGAREAAEQPSGEGTAERVVLAAMRAAEPVQEVVRRR
ncbi:MAG: selenium cofactor biosynthesis protein YqeC [Arhodomonas sp.]|nr:selenium cofactor biosynthesis protein YqeC [Arhodomonas sp.]